MRMPFVLLLSPLLFCTCSNLASAASSEWAHVQGGAVRIVTTGKPDADGTLRGALQIDLKPGWKTYWRDPGDTGVPPKISVTGATLANVAYPVPKRFDEGGTVWNGYEAAVDFALNLKAKDGSEEIVANVFLGICQSICIPLQAHLSLKPNSDPDNAGDAAIVKQAFENAPAPARSGLRVTTAKPQGKDAFEVDTELSRQGPEAVLFVAAPEGYSFGPAKSLGRTEGGATFSMRVYERPESPALGATASYTLVQGDSAVEGTVKLP